MAVSWNIQYGAEQKPAALWNVANIQRTLVSQGRDEVTFDVIGDYAAASSFAYGQILRIYRDGVQWFYGIITKVPRLGSVPDERISYTVSGIWYFLENLTFKVRWPNWNTGALVLDYSTRILLNRGATNSTIYPTNTQIEAILQYAIDQGMPIQIGTISVSLYPPIDEVVDATCAECIRRQLRWHPDAVFWFDYSTTPPTAHCKPRSALTAATLAIGDIIGSVNLTPLSELQRNSVAIVYETTTEIDGKQYIDLRSEVWPPHATGRELGCLCATISLQGPRITNLNAQISCEPYQLDAVGNFNALAVAWFKRKFPELADERIADLQITEVARVKTPEYTAEEEAEAEESGVPLDYDPVPSSELPNELIAGQIAPWMADENGDAFQVEKERISILASYNLYDDNPEAVGGNAGHILQAEDKIFTRECYSTDAPSGVYHQANEDFSEADPQPNGLAQFLYNAVADLQYAGTVETTEDDLTGRVTLARKLNISGSLSDFATMNAMVQSIHEIVDTGQTTITLGPAEHLGPADLVALLKAQRDRQRKTPLSVQDSGEFGSSAGDAQMGKNLATANSQAAQHVPTYFKVRGTPDNFTVEMTASADKGISVNRETDPLRGFEVFVRQCQTPAGTAQRIKPREMTVCIDGDSNWRVMAICSAPYRPGM